MAALRHVMIQYGIISLKITECHFVDRLMGSFALPMEAITRPGTLQHKRISQLVYLGPKTFITPRTFEILIF